MPRRNLPFAACVVLLISVLAAGVSGSTGPLPIQGLESSPVHVHGDGELHVHAPSDSPALDPAAGTPFSFGAAGDFGFSRDTQSVMDAMGGAGLDFVIPLGDTAYTETSEQNWCDYFESRMGDGRVLLIAGNHDTGESSGGNINVYRQHCNFGISADYVGDYGKEYYFDYPRTEPLARFILTGCGLSFSVDGQGKWTCNAGDPHYNFVANAIDDARNAAIPWVFVGMHKNCITNGVKSCEIGEAFQDLLLSKKVDLVLQAHEHNYQRSKQLSCADDNNYRSECVVDSDDSHDHGAGEIINVVGTGGRSLYPTGGTPDEPYFVKWNSDTKGFLQVDVSATALTLSFKNVAGSFTDSYEIRDAAPPAPDFSISANPRAVTFPASGSATTTVTVQSVGGFSGTIDLTAASSPSGVSTTCNPSSITGGSGTSTCTITASNTGTYTVTITGTSGNLVHSTSVSVTVTAPPTPDFTISANPSTVTFPAGGSGTSVVTIESQHGFTGTVDLTASSSPPGVLTVCDPTSIPGGSGSATCTLASAVPGTYTVTITGTSGSLVHSAMIAVTVLVPGPTARFTFSPSTPRINEPVSFDASASTDTDPVATLESRWDWESDGKWDTAYSGALTAQHTFPAGGTYPVTVEVRDSHGYVDTESRAVFVLDAGDAGAPPGYGLTNASRLQARGPIVIRNNSAFTAANGVRQGTGTAADPYVISNWFIDGSLYPGNQVMIWVEATDKHLVIENNKIVNLAHTNHWEAIQLGHWPAIIGTSHVTIRHNHVENARHAYGIAVREGSSDILIESNYVHTDANYEWVHGIATDRNVRDVTIVGNYVNAYTSGYFHTTGIHISDTHVDDARRAVNVVTIRNTVVNATAGGIVSLSSSGTRIEANLVFMDYPGAKSVGPNYPRGIVTGDNSDRTTVVRNVVSSFTWGIQVGSDRGLFVSNTISDVDYAIYVVDNGTIPGATSFDETIYDTTYSGVASEGIRLPAIFHGTVVDVGPFVRKTDLSAILLRTLGPANEISVSWSGNELNVSVRTNGLIAYDTVLVSENQTLVATWSGSIEALDVNALQAARVAFQLEGVAEVSFTGEGFLPGEAYRLDRTGTGGTSTVLSVTSSPSGGLVFTVPAAAPSTYSLLAASAAPDTVAPASATSVSGTVGANGWHTSTVEVTVTAGDDLSGVATIHVRMDGGAWTVYDAPISLSGDGTHTVEHYAVDGVGNSEEVQAMSVRIDATPPVVSDLVPSGRVTNPDVTVSWKGHDAASGIAGYAVSINGREFEPIGDRVTDSRRFGDGSHTVRVKAVDRAGLETVAETSFMVESETVVSPLSFQSIPVYLPGIALVGLGIGYAILGHGRRNRRTGPVRRRYVSDLDDWDIIESDR